MKKLLFILLFALGFTACESDEDDPFLITKDQVGAIKKDLKINQLDSIFSNDSLVSETKGSENMRFTDEIKIFEKDGTPLLRLEPLQEFDSTSTIGYVRVLDSRYHTKEGLSTKSTFKDIVENYKISRIENTLNSAVVFLEDINIYITIDKKQLPSSLRYDTDSRIRASQIPDDAEIKYFIVYWD